MNAELRNPYWSGDPEPRPKVRFSQIEFLHLAVAVGVLSLAFSLFRAKSQDPTAWFPSPLQFFAALLAVGTGFVLHELAHKVVAQHYGHWAEFRAHMTGLLVGLLLALLSPILVAAPGAVFIRGQVTYRENGFISIVGPGLNLVLAVLAFVLLRALFHVDPNDGVVSTILSEVARVNAMLAVFNLIPAGPFDGKKVWVWSRPVYVATAVLAVLVLAIVLIFSS